MELARAVDVMMVRANRIFILIIQVNKLFSFFSSQCFLKEIAKHVLRACIELKKHSSKFGRTRKNLRLVFPQHFSFSQTSIRVSRTPQKHVTCFLFLNYYMASYSSVSGQTEPNSVLRLATRAGKMELSCPQETTRCVPQQKFIEKSYNKSFLDQACSVKKWLRRGP